MNTSRTRAKQATRLTGAITVVGGSLVIGATPAANAVTLVVDTASDNPADGLTLREAINTAVDGDIITFAPSLDGETITLDNDANGVERVDTSITIQGLGEDALTLSANSGDVLYVYNASATITDLTIVNSDANGINVNDSSPPLDASLTVERVTIEGSENSGIRFASDSGALALTDSTISGSGGDGVSVGGAGSITLLRSSSNSNDGDGLDADDIGDNVAINEIDVSISEGTFNDNREDGARFDDVGGSIAVTGSSFERNRYSGLNIEEVDGTTSVMGTDFLDNGDYAGRLRELVGDVTVSGVSSTETRSTADGDFYIRGDNSASPKPNMTISQITGVGDVDFRAYNATDLTFSDIVLNGEDPSLRGRRVDGNALAENVQLISPEGESTLYFYSVDGDATADNVVSDGRASFRQIDQSVVVSDSSFESLDQSDEGFYVRYAAAVAVTDTTISSPYEAIEIRRVYADAGAGLDGDVTMTRVDVSGGAEGGVEMYRIEGGGVFADVEISGSEGIGLEALYVSDLELDRVTIADHERAGLTVGRSGSNVTITSSTMVGNGKNDDDQTLYFYGGTVSIAHSTIAENDASGGATIEIYNADVTVDHTVVTENGSGVSNISGTGSIVITNSLVPVGSGLGPSNVESDTADLSPLGDLGGETRVAAPLPGSPAVDAGDPAIVGEPATDQRGGPRKVGTIDIGAVEVDGTGSVSVADATVDENAGVVSVEVERTGSLDFPISVDLATVSGSATAGADFTETTETVSFGVGDVTPKTVDVPIIVDTLAEPDETFEATLSNAVDTTIDGSATVTILDVPPPLAALAPERFADTRSGQSTVDDDFNGDGKLAAGGSYTVQIAGRGDVPVDAKAVTMNVTAIGAESNGFVTVHPCLATPPNASSLNYTTGVNLGNEVTVPLDADGKACFFSSGAVHLTVDVVAYVPDGSRGFPVTPARLLDTRVGQSTIDGVGAGRGRVPAGATERVQVAGRGGVPVDAASVIVNVTAIGAAGTGFVTVHPCLPVAPNASSLNVVAGVNRGNELIAEVDANGEICLFVSTEMNLTVDVTGYVPSGTALNSVSPGRLLDTRDNGETVDGDAQGGGKPAAGSETTLQVGGRGGVPADARAAIVNVTAIGPEANGFVTVHPCLATRPSTAALNYVPGVNGGNEIVASLNADGEICLFTSASTHLAVDIVGYLA